MCFTYHKVLRWFRHFRKLSVVVSQSPCTFQLRCGHQLPTTRTETANKRVFKIQDLLTWCWTAPVKSVRSHIPFHNLQSPSWEFLVLTLGLKFLFLSCLPIMTTPGFILKIAFQPGESSSSLNLPWDINTITALNTSLGFKIPILGVRSSHLIRKWALPLQRNCYKEFQRVLNSSKENFVGKMQN